MTHPDPNHHVSLEMAKRLVEAGIVFEESEKVWIKWKHHHPKEDGWQLLPRYISTDNKNAIEVVPAPNLNETLDELLGYAVLNMTNRRYRSSWLRHDFLCTKAVPATEDTGSYSCQMIDRFETYIKKGSVANTAPDAAGLMLLKVREGETGD